MSLFTCRTQVLALIAPEYNETTTEWQPSTDIYPPTERSHPPGFPADIVAGNHFSSSTGRAHPTGLPADIIGGNPFSSEGGGEHLCSTFPSNYYEREPMN